MREVTAGESPPLFCVRAVSRAHFEYTLGMFGLREHRSVRPSTSKGSLRREGGSGREEREEREERGR